MKQPIVLTAEEASDIMKGNDITDYMKVNPDFYYFDISVIVNSDCRSYLENQDKFKNIKKTQHHNGQ
eukprot:CAMPEP_0168341224 /NCGR_PEP_ID=MMETSP0213-20121227/14544_1 /TAXON_ID=151035 /ORGANISM="Euplotes harpa, Strain FSP1.4" /LENGTH=66 /DNA_ID=CAMNT_0008347635 /DNA_START=568 /DNA_END=765 /DNA_ORIENTATION=-